MLVVSQRVPNISQFEDESFYRPFAWKRVDANKFLRIATGTVEHYGAFARLNQPCQRGTVLYPFLHLLANGPRTVTGGSQFNDEVRAQVPEAFPLDRIQLLNTGLQRPGCVGRSARSVGQHKASRRVAHQSAAILFCPIGKLAPDLRIPNTGNRERSGHDDEFPIGGHFKKQVGMFRAQSSEPVVGHRMGSEDGGQMFLIDCKRHILSVTRCSTVDDITVVTVRRNS